MPDTAILQHLEEADDHAVTDIPSLACEMFLWLT